MRGQTLFFARYFAFYEKGGSKREREREREDLLLLLPLAAIRRAPSLFLIHSLSSLPPLLVFFFHFLSPQPPPSYSRALSRSTRSSFWLARVYALLQPPSAFLREPRAFFFSHSSRIQSLFRNILSRPRARRRAFGRGKEES